MREPSDYCPTCAEPVAWDYAWRDDLSASEYEISGMCQACQDRIFAPDEEQAALRNL